MKNMSPHMATVQALRSDVALQLARFTQRMGLSQAAAAKRLGLPQPTLSKIINGRVSDVSLELLIRTAARAGLAMTSRPVVSRKKQAPLCPYLLAFVPRRRSELGEDARESLSHPRVVSHPLSDFRRLSNTISSWAPYTRLDASLRRSESAEHSRSCED